LFEKTLHLYNPNIRISMGQQLLDNPWYSNLRLDLQVIIPLINTIRNYTTN
jgi:hypothetical protein